jgi:hypothetical protein
MNSASPTMPRPHALVALVALIAAILATLVAGPAPTASAQWSGAIGRPGGYQVTFDAKNRQAMIRAHIYWDNKRTFYTNGVKVDASAASTKPQTINARYRLEYWSHELNSWVPMQQAVKTATIPGYVPGEVSPVFTMPGHHFVDPPLQGVGTAYRIMYTVEWLDAATQQLIGYRDVYPDAYNNFCPTNIANTVPCTVYTEDIHW